MPERIRVHMAKLGVVLGEDHDLDEAAIKALIRKCELARVPFSIRGGVFFVGEEPLLEVPEGECIHCLLVMQHEHAEPADEPEDEAEETAEEE